MIPGRCAGSVRDWGGEGSSDVSSYGVLTVDGDVAVVAVWPATPVDLEHSASQASIVFRARGPSGPAGLPEVVAALDAVSAALWRRFAQSDDIAYWQWLRGMTARVLAGPPPLGTRLANEELDAVAWLGRAAAASGSSEVAAAVRGEVAVEVDAVAAAVLGELGGRAAQALRAERPRVDPRQVDVAAQALHAEALGVGRLEDLARVEPASAAVAVASWLWAAARLWARASGRAPLDALDAVPAGPADLAAVAHGVVHQPDAAESSMRGAVEPGLATVGATRLLVALADAYGAVRQAVVDMTAVSADGSAIIGVVRVGREDVAGDARATVSAALARMLAGMGEAPR